MRRKPFSSVPFDRLDTLDGDNCTNWIWDGYLARGNITLLTSLWKAGKTTLVAGLLERLGSAGKFLDHACAQARALVVSEESREHWAERRRLFPIGPHAELITRPFLTRPSPRQWSDLIDHALRLRAKKRLDLFVVDPLASFLPGHSESDPGTLLTMLQPLQMLAGRGVAVLILHHPRKEASEEGSTARGSGALLGYVDIILELHRFGRLATDECRRKLVGLSRHKATPRRLAYQWAPDTGAFERLDDLDSLRYRENWDQVRALLKKRKMSATRRDLLDEWPDEQNKPSSRTLWDWLTRAVASKKAVCSGSGTRTDPFRYRLRNSDDDYYDRGELPPLKDLF
jgi:hypothetical protein